jgi:hypothetical protein
MGQENHFSFASAKIKSLVLNRKDLSQILSIPTYFLRAVLKAYVQSLYNLCYKVSKALRQKQHILCI